MDATAFNCLIFTIALIKKGKLSRYTRMVVQKSNIGHLYKIFRYKTLKILRSYLPSERQERVKIVKMRLPR